MVSGIIEVNDEVLLNDSWIKIQFLAIFRVFEAFFFFFWIFQLFFVVFLGSLNTFFEYKFFLRRFFVEILTNLFINFEEIEVFIEFME